MAQVVEHILGKDEVTSSNLVNSSKNRQISSEVCRFFFPCLQIYSADSESVITSQQNQNASFTQKRKMPQYSNLSGVKQPSALEIKRAVGISGGFGVVGDKQDCSAALTQLDKLLHHLSARTRIERSGRLVG